MIENYCKWVAVARLIGLVCFLSYNAALRIITIQILQRLLDFSGDPKPTQVCLFALSDGI